jgi:uncharacterized membrane protein HdeD (DUF308 family)
VATIFSPGLSKPIRHELAALRGEWLWFLILGIGLIVLGVIAIGAPIVTTLYMVEIYGVLLIAGGILQAVGSFWSRDWSGFFLSLLFGVLYFVLGIFFIRYPSAAAMTLTILLAAFLIVGGIFRIVAALVMRFPFWGWALIGGLLNLLLGLLIWAQWPFSGLWVIGLFLGIELIYMGCSWVILAFALKRLPRPAS